MVLSGGGATASLLDLVEVGALVPILSPALLEELAEVLQREKFRRYLSVQEAVAYLGRLERRGESADDPQERPRVSADPKDDYLVALARLVRADALVSGDSDLTQLHLPDVLVLNPRQLLDRLQR